MARFGIPGGGLVNTTTSFVATSFMGLVSAYGPEGRVDFLLTGSVFADLGLLRARDLAYVWGAGQHAEHGTIRGCVGGRVELGSGEGFVLASGDGAGHTILDLYRITVSAVASYDPVTGQTPRRRAREGREPSARTTSSRVPPASGAQAGAFVYDPTDDGLIFQLQLADGAQRRPGLCRQVAAGRRPRLGDAGAGDHQP